MRRSALLVVIGVAVLAFAPLTNGAPTPRPIVFEATRDLRQGGLLLMNADGSGRRYVAGAHSSQLVVARDGAYAYADSFDQVHEFVRLAEHGATRTFGPGRPIMFSPDGGTLVTQAPDGTVELRDRATGTVRLALPGTKRLLAWTPRGLVLETFEPGGTYGLELLQGDGADEHAIASHLGGAFVGPSVSPDGGWIAYGARPDPNATDVLHVVRTDGSDDHALTGVGAGGVVWSPDGTHIAVATLQGNLMLGSPLGPLRDTGATVYGSPGSLGSWSPDGTQFAFQPGTPTAAAGSLTIVTAETGSIRVLDGVGAVVDWSPDGRRLLLATDNGLSVVSATAAGAQPRLLARDTQEHAWLPDGRLLVYVNEEQGEQLATVAPTGGRPRFIPGMQNEVEPAWSRDGTKLAFASLSDDSSSWTIGVADADGSHRRAIAHSGANAPSPSWSPDGRFIAYADYDAIYIVPSTGGKRRFVAHAELPWTVAWSPDGRRIAFGNVPDDSDDADIVLVDPDGKHRRIVVQGGAGANWGGIAWSPDGKTLAVPKVSYEGGDPDGTPDLYLVTVQSGHQREFWFGGSDPSYAPDGKRIVLTDVETYGGIETVGVAKSARGRELGSGSGASWGT